MGSDSIEFSIPRRYFVRNKSVPFCMLLAVSPYPISP